jgi:hypothetical protein
MIFSASSHDALILVVSMLGAGTVAYIISDPKEEYANSNDNSIIAMEVGVNKWQRNTHIQMERGACAVQS